MNALLDHVFALVALVPQDKIQLIAKRVRELDVKKSSVILPDLVGTALAKSLVQQLVSAWHNTSVTSNEFASMLIVASHVYEKVSNEQSTELVWTGPTTPFVSARRTEQALLEVINSAQENLFITSFVAYDVSSVVVAMNEAIKRGVSISMLLELSQSQGGNISFDAIGKMKLLVPAAKLFAWHNKQIEFLDGSVHAKVAVADGKICFISSANLTGHAMEKNIEAGILIRGGRICNLLNLHLKSLVDTKIVTLV